jgi:hypothetical protein
MNAWMTTANEFIVMFLGYGHSSVERVIIAACGLLGFFLMLKLFTKVDGGGNIAWLKRFIVAALLIISVLIGVVAAALLIVPHTYNEILQKIIFVVLPLLILMIITVPVMMLLLRKDYGSALVTAVSVLVAGAVVVFAVSFVINSLQGSDKEFRSLKRRTHNIDEFISQ